ncbi:DUF4347 domain-containing protein [Leptolyngbyaceae cyanobacterium UHCC 1019]
MLESTLRSDLVSTGSNLAFSDTAWIDQLIDPLAAPLSLTGSSSAIAFVDTGLSDYQTLVDGLAPNTAVYLLNPAGDELSQISQVLAGYSNLASVSVFSHGSNGALQLGNTSLNSANLIDYAGILQSWSRFLTEDADLLFYGCDLAADATGQNFVSQIAALTGADVAASSDLTGSSALGGDWELEFATGSIETSEFLSDWAQAAYQNVLATFTVTNLNNDGAGSLRQAIAAANTSTEADTINFSVAGTITLGSQLDLTDSAKTTINGGNAITVSGNDSVRVFQINSGATAELNGLTITRGKPISGIIAGGGILNSGGALTVNNSTFSENAARFGGAIFSVDGTVTVNNSTFSGNSATAGGGAIDSSSIDGTAVLTVNNSTFSGNSTTGNGGAINIDSLNGDGSAVLTVNNSTFSGNSATGDGGGISNFLGAFTINNSLVAGNSASTGREIYDFNADFSTGSNNLFGYSGSSGYEALTSFPGFFLTYVTPTVGLDQILNTTLANNGGSTQTLALLPTLSLTVQANKTVTLLEDTSSTALGITAPTAPNPAVNAGRNTLLPANTNFDQRGTGFTRIVGGTVDIGAFELQTPLPTPTITVTGLPDATKGAVYLADGTTAVTLNQSLTTAQLAGLVFKPVANANGSAGTFNYSVTAGTNTQSQTITLNITPVNDAPVATNDSFTTNEDTALTGNVITNTTPNGADSDPDGNPLTVATVNGSAANVGTAISLTNGSLTLNGSGSFTYTPTANANGGFTSTLNGGGGFTSTLNGGGSFTSTSTLNASDSFTYTLSDGTFASNTATVSLTIAAVNDAPVVANPLGNQSSPEDTAVNFTIPVNTFSDVDNSTLALSASLADNTALPSWLSFDSATGTFSGTPPLNFNGTLALKVTATDAGNLSAASNFNLVITSVNDAPVVSTIADQTTGQNTATSPISFTISDVETAASSLTMTATSSNTALFPNGSIVFGGSGANRTITLTPANNQFGTAMITVNVSDGNLVTPTTFTVTVGRNLNGGNGKDTLNGTAGNDRINGGNGDDTLFGGAGNDFLLGGNGDDVLRGGLGNDILNGGNGSDRFVLTAGEGTDTIQDFQNGTDKFVLAGGLTYNQLTVQQEGTRTRLLVTATGEVLAYLDNVNFNLIDVTDFVVVS